MKVKELERTVNIAWSPANYHPILLAAGTAAQQLDASFNTSASLDLYSLNLSEPGLDLEQKCSVPSKNRFHRVEWGGTGAGVIVGGCDGGAIQVYNAGRILKGEDGLIAHQDRHTGPVRAIHFNPFQLNLMATGAADSDIFIWDLNNISTPMSPGSKTQPYEDVLSLAWNKQVQHILASTFHSRCIVWDLRKNEPIIKLTDSNSRVRWKEAAWHPDVPTQLCLASEDDALPVIQLWDLRFATSPLRSLAQHSRGVLSLAWCNQDPDLLVSSGKDNRILCWNPNADHPTGLVECEIVNVQQMIFEVAWCPRNPNLIACASADGHTSIYNLTASQTTVLTSNKIADSFPGMEALAMDQPAAQQQSAHVELTKPPKWMRRPCGASFSFGGRLVWFNSAGGMSVTVGQVQLEDLSTATRADAALASLESGKAADLCRDRSDPLWSFLGAAFDANPPAAIRSLLGYPEAMNNTKDVNSITDDMANLSQNDDYYSNSINGSDAFDMLAAQKEAAKKKEPPKPLASFSIHPGSGDGGQVIEALLAGDMKTAAEKCLSSGLIADALLLASAAGPDVMASTQNEYFQSFAEKTSTAELIRAIVTGDWQPLVDSCDLNSWREVLVAVLTYASPLHFPALSMALGRRLEEAGGDKVAGAEVCYVAAGSFAALIRHRIASVSSSSPNLASSATLQELVEMVLVGRAAEQSRGSVEPADEEVSKLLADFALLLTADGHLQLALAYLGPAQGAQADELRESIMLNLGLKQQPQAFPTEQRRPSGDPKSTRKFSNSVGVRDQFSKMSTMGAARANAALGTAPPPMTPTPMIPSPMVPSPMSQGPHMVPGGPPGVPMVPGPMAPPPSSTSPSLPLSGASGKKYVVDPSVGSHRVGGVGGVQFPPGGQFLPAGQNFPPGGQALFQPSGPVGPADSAPPPTQSQGAGLPPSAQWSHNSAPGWNDPPILSTNRAQKRISGGTAGAAAAPARGRTISGGFDAPPAPQGNSFGRNVGAPSNQFVPPTSPPDNQFGAPPSAGQFGVPSQPGSSFGVPPPPNSQFGGPPTQNSQFGVPSSQSTQFGGPVPKSNHVGGLPPQQVPFGGPPLQSNTFGGPPPQSSQFGGPPPQSTHLGGPSPQSSQLGGPPPQSSQFGGPPHQGPQFGGAPTQSSQFGGPPQSTQFGGPPPPQSSQFGGPPPPQSSQFGGPPPPQSSQFGGQPPQSSQFGGQPPQSSQLGGPPPQNSQFGGPPSQNSQFGGPPPQGSQFGGPPLQASQLGGPPQLGEVPPQNNQFGRPPSSLAGTLPPIQPAGAGIPPVQTSGQSTPSRGGRSSGRSTPHQVNGGAGYGDPPLSSTPKQPLPQSCQHIQDVLEQLRSSCHNTSNNPQMKRKLEDVARKLELLYDSLRESKLSGGSVEGLEALVRQVEVGDYAGALTQHSRMAAGPDFSHIAAFMPALKLLVQSALQLNVYLS